MYKHSIPFGDIEKVLPNRTVTDDVLAEVSFAATKMKKWVANSVVLFEKELAGGSTVFALDFDILHAYMFPSFQSATSNYSPNLIAFALENCPAQLVMPPGTVTELVEYVHRHFPTLVRAEEKAIGSRNLKLSEAEKSYFSQTYRELIDPSLDPIEAFGQAEDYVFQLADTASAFSNGISRLFEFVREKKIVSFSERFPDWKDHYEPGIQAEIQSKLVANAPREGKLRKKNVVNDSRSLGSLICNYSRQKGLTEASRSGDLYDFCTTHFVTGSRRLRRIDLGFDDLLQKSLNIFPSILNASSDYWLCQSPESVAVYSIFKRDTRSVKEALSLAIHSFSKLSDLDGLTLKTYKDSKDGKPAQLSKSDYKDLISVFSSGWYLTTRTLLNVSAAEKSRLSLVDSIEAESPTAQFYEGDMELESHDTKRRRHVFDILVGNWDSSRNDPDVIFKAFGVTSRSAKIGHINTLLIKNIFTDEQLLSFKVWHSKHLLYSARWSTRLDLDQTILFVNSIITHLSGRKGEVLIHFEDLQESARKHYLGTDVCVYEEDTNTTSFVYSKFGKSNQLQAKSFIVSPDPGSYSKDFLTASRVSIRCEIFDLHLGLPGNLGSSQVSGRDVIFTYANPQAPEFFVATLLESTHSWNWCKPVIKHLAELINLNSKNAV